MRCREALVGARKLLVAEQRVLDADEIVLRLVDREHILGITQPRLQFLQTSGQIGGGAPRGGRLRALRFREIGVGNGIGEHRRLRRIVRPDLDIDHEATLGLANDDVAGERIERDGVIDLRGGGEAQLDPEQMEQRRQRSPGFTAELGILVETGVLDHLEQYAVGGDQPGLAFHHHRQAGNVLGARRQLAVDQLQFARVDIELGGGGEFRRETLADDDCGNRATERGRDDGGLAPPQQAEQRKQVEARRRGRARPRAGFPLIYRLVKNKHPQLPFELPHASAEGLRFGSRDAPKGTRNQRNRKH